MKIYVDSNEYAGHPQIIEGINKYLNIKTEKNKNDEIFKCNEVISEHLLVGDYRHNKILIEHKSLSDFGGSVMDGRIFQQAQDLLHCMSLDSEVRGYILISGNISDIIKLSYLSEDKKTMYPFKLSPMIAAAASLNRIGIPTIFLGDQYCFINFMIDLFIKYYDGKIREYSPVRKPQEFDDIVLSNYCSLVGEKTAKKLILKFPYPKLLYNATKEQLLEVEGIGKETADFIINVTEGREKSWKTLEEKKKILKENKKSLKEAKNHKIVERPKDLNLPAYI